MLIISYLKTIITMNVSSEKLEEIYKVYDEKRNNRIPTSEIGILNIMQPNSFGQPDYFPASRTSKLSRRQ